ncbi:DUF2868 domain-containing protein [Erythrobacter arachoides]|uniref:DUF2868 domain-containing protein n=1 Tax=Aurantiacibacter arachoides TaxID=1850444 RepID=A0A845A4C6_9SPHN|nr:DUF2868 domain-containing protein [Aurantiacibacter arachoides]MXO94520.1 DUF2868 domain-containing protein [Aurantiacibacter arachoides]GGD62826.1 hypothetical protein GCM10011411_23860 [Aurantiacibacter arachoides]
MTEDEARAVELVRAIELEDRDRTLFTAEDRSQADARARAAAGDPGSKTARERLLATRAQFAAARLTTRHPGMERLLAKSRWPGWLGVGLPLLGLVLGVLANEFGTDQRLDLLAVPLLGTVAWNLLVYLWLALSAITGKRHAAAPVLELAAEITGRRKGDFENGTALQRAADGFRRRWAELTARLSAARLARTLHLGAALFAAGLIGGIYARALVIEYRAGWESTFLGPEAVHALLLAVLGPASALSGVPVPPVEEIAAMRWRGDDLSGVNAGPWIHLYTLTVGALVVLPRLALAAFEGAGAMRLARTLPVAGRGDFYVRRLLRSAGGHPGRARVTPYAYRPGEETERRLRSALTAALGDGAAVTFDTPVDYGAEEAWLARHDKAGGGDPEEDYHLLLFTLSATPEAENHGEIARRIAAEIARVRPGTVLAAVVDEAPFRAHFAGQAGLDQRIATRLAAWRDVLGPAGIAPIGLDLSRSDELAVSGALAERLEAALLRDGDLAA